MKKMTLVLLVLVVAIIPLFAGGSKQQAGGTTGPTKITVSTTGIVTDILDKNSPIYKELEKTCNVSLELNLIPDKSYLEKFSALVASNSLTDVMYIDTLLNNAFMSALKGNAFWKLNSYIPKLPNISKVDSGLLMRASLEGEIYGLSRDRQIGRLGLIYRKDWADKLGIGAPKTVEDLYNMAKAFTERDPDGNGQKDTFGLSEGKSMGQGSFANFGAWFGAGAGGGPARQYILDKDNKVIPVFATEEFIASMNFSRRLYKDGYMNQDFVSTSSRADNILASKAGMSMGAMDDSNNMLPSLKKLVPGAEFAFAGALDAGKGLRAAAENAGYKGYYIFAKTVLKNEESLMKALMFFDKMNTVEVNNLIEYGIPGTHYTVQNGIAVVTPEQADKVYKDRHDLGQLRTFNLTINPCMPRQSTQLQIDCNNAIAENNKRYIVGIENGLYSETLAKNGAAMQNEVNDANAKYIMGQLDEAGWKAAVAKWYSSGGDKICAELTASYQKLKAAK